MKKITANKHTNNMFEVCLINENEWQIYEFSKTGNGLPESRFKKNGFQVQYCRGCSAQIGSQPL